MIDPVKSQSLQSCRYTALYLLVLCGLFSCSRTTSSAPEDVPPISGDAIRLVAETHCSGCHLFPEPGLLDKKTWTDHVLPNMGYRFGIYTDRARASLLERGRAGKVVEAANVFPLDQTISNETWNTIKQYYTDHAPEKLVSDERAVSMEGLPFAAVQQSFRLPRPATSALCFDNAARTLMVADCSQTKNSTIHVFDSALKLTTTLGLPHPVSNMTIHNDSLYILMMGHFVPSDQEAGSLLMAIKDANGNYEGYKVILKQLKRPVDVSFADLDEDGDDDIVVCEYGNHTGSLSLFLKQGNKYTKRILHDVTGPVRAIIRDMNDDMHSDIVVLTAQGDERLEIYFNDGQGNFVKETVLRFPPSYGSVFFSLEDMNHDGFPDIIYANGDNADLSRILKPYHGVRIFLNDGHNTFSESFFFPMHGAYKTVVADFDQDGDMDIAAIAFFPDFENHPKHGFTYLENRSENGVTTFAAATFSDAEKGRWIAMTTGDPDNDGDTDLFLGSFTHMEITADSSGRRLEQLQKTSPSFIVLKNVTR